MREPAVIQRASTTFCWLPPESLRQAASGPGALILSRLIQSVRKPALHRIVDPAILHDAREIGKRDVFGDRRNITSPSTRRSRGI